MEILLIGAGGHALSCIDVIEQETIFSVYGLIGQDHEKGLVLHGYKVLGSDSNLPEILDKCPNALIAVGQIRSANKRIALFELASGCGYRFPVLVSPSAYVSPRASLGRGTIVMPGAVVNAGVQVGDNCIINSSALLEHNVLVGDHCHISTGAILNGDVSVGDANFIGSGSIIREGTSIGDGCLIGMGAHVLKNMDDFSSYISNK